MRIVDVQQGSPEWFAARCGTPSSSNFDKIVTSKGLPSKQRLKYLYKLAGETITGIVEESYQNAAMLRGKEIEGEARQFYGLVNGVEVKQVGFCIYNGFGASPDGLIGDDGLVEIKCPIMSTHIGYLLEDKFPAEYFQQVQGQLLVTGRDWVDFISYYPGLKPLIVRVERDIKFTDGLEIELITFCSELRELVEKIK